jgi:hypothetical protein
MVVFSPWMIRNYHWKGNPIYPLYNQAFNTPKTVKSGSSPQSVNRKGGHGFLATRALIYKETGLQIALLPVRIFFQGKDGDPKYFDGKLNPFLLFLPFFAFYRVKDEPDFLRREKKFLLVFSILFFSFAFFSSGLRIRYIAPIIPPLTVLSVFGLRNIFSIGGQMSSHNAKKACITLALLIPCIALALNAGYLMSQFKSVDPIPFITGKISRDQYIEKYIPEYPALLYINNKLNPHAKILFVLIGKRGYYCNREYTNDMGILQRSINKAEKTEDILDELKKNGITHLLINYRLFERWMDDTFPEEKRVLTQAFFKEQSILLYGENEFGISLLK